MNEWVETLADGRYRIEVDGIVCVGDPVDWSVQPMFDLRPDHREFPESSCRQVWNRPPTEAELDWWVKDGDEEWDYLPWHDPTR